MKVTHKFKIPYDKNLYNKLRSKQMEAAKVWNDVLKYSNQHYFFFKKWISKSHLESYTKNTYDLSAQTVQGIVAKFEQNRQATKELRKNNKKIKYSWKYKRFYCIPYKEASISIEDDKIILKNSNYSSSLSLVKLTERLNKKKLKKKVKFLSLFLKIKMKLYFQIFCQNHKVLFRMSRLCIKKGLIGFIMFVKLKKNKTTIFSNQQVVT